MTPDAILVSLIGGALAVLIAVVGFLLSQKVGSIDKKLDELSEKVSSLGEHKARTEERLKALEEWRGDVDGEFRKRRRA